MGYLIKLVLTSVTGRDAMKPDREATTSSNAINTRVVQLLLLLAGLLVIATAVSVVF
jgi:hypothetical protein